jgi:stage II sporulation protein AA (anti-sigma F factor antagonist)
MEFTCTAHQSGPQLIATVAGDIDLAIHPRFRAEAQVWVGKHTDVVLDCSGVTFMDSMGLRVLVELWRGVTEAGHRFALARPSTSVTRVLELAGLVGVFEYAELPEPAAEELAA